MSSVKQKKNPLFENAFGALKGVIAAIALISGTVNLLALTGSFYMMQVYDRVLTSQSVPTLVALSVLAIGLYVFQGSLEIIRSQLLVRIGSRFDRRVSATAHDAVARLPLYGRQGADGLQPIRDIDSIRGFLSGQGPVSLLDMPWMPLYFVFIFLLHPVLGWITVAGAVFLITLTLWTERLTKEPSKLLVTAASQRLSIAQASERNAEVLRAMGFAHRKARRFLEANHTHLKAQEKLNDIAGGLSALSRIARLILQSGLLGIGALLTIKGEMSAGAIIACSIAASRALAPIEIAIGNWKGFVAARQSYTRLSNLFAKLPQQEEVLELPAPVKSLSVEGIVVAAPGTQRVVLNNITFALEAGQALAVIGPSAAGKSTLARAITGAWAVSRGSVRLDGAALEQWAVEQLGQYLGYLPQDVELFDGTITENITRFEEEPNNLAVVEAARAAGVHEMILRLPDGYEMQIGERGSALSAGQRQRVALARALYKNPFLVVLDEPNSNLDAEGEQALALAVASVKARNGIAVVVSHRSGILAAVDHVAVIGNGQLTAFGPRDEVLKKAVRPPQQGGVAVGGAPTPAERSSEKVKEIA